MNKNVVFILHLFVVNLIIMPSFRMLFKFKILKYLNKIYGISLTVLNHCNCAKNKHNTI